MLVPDAQPYFSPPRPPVVFVRLLAPGQFCHFPAGDLRSVALSGHTSLADGQHSGTRARLALDSESENFEWGEQGLRSWKYQGASGSDMLRIDERLFAPTHHSVGGRPTHPLPLEAVEGRGRLSGSLKRVQARGLVSECSRFPGTMAVKGFAGFLVEWPLAPKNLTPLVHHGWARHADQRQSLPQIRCSHTSALVVWERRTLSAGASLRRLLHRIVDLYWPSWSECSRRSLGGQAVRHGHLPAVVEISTEPASSSSRVGD